MSLHQALIQALAREVAKDERPSEPAVADAFDVAKIMA